MHQLRVLALVESRRVDERADGEHDEEHAQTFDARLESQDEDLQSDACFVILKTRMRRTTHRNDRTVLDFAEVHVSAQSMLTSVTW